MKVENIRISDLEEDDIFLLNGLEFYVRLKSNGRISYKSTYCNNECELGWSSQRWVEKVGVRAKLPSRKRLVDIEYKINYVMENLSKRTITQMSEFLNVSRFTIYTIIKNNSK